MAVAFHGVEGFVPLPGERHHSLPRTTAILSAIGRSRDFTLVQQLVRPVGDERADECLIVDVTCDGVPKHNDAGLLYRERLAVRVPADHKELVEVIPLRQDFPLLMHANSRAGVPAMSLCLYFEPAISISRTWTAETLLRRIQWWLEKSATGDLHPTDQPLEQLFFNTGFELVLPWNLTELRKNPTQQFTVVAAPERPNGGGTFFLVAPGSHPDANGIRAGLVEVVLPAVTHGVVESIPRTLGELADVLAKREVDLAKLISDSIVARVGTAGVLAPNDSFTIVLLYVPVRRTDDAEPDSQTYRAYIVPNDWVALGVSLGSLVQNGARFYRAILLAAVEPSLSWRDVKIDSMDVRFFNDPATFRKQSGISGSGPNGVLIGAGSLGSAILNLWSRSGWGTWTIVDKDYIKPHNLARHVGFAQHVGHSKVEVVYDLHNAITLAAIPMTPIETDACDFNNTALTDILKSCDLVVDASTTLEYPRAVSALDEFRRHISIFLTPSGNSSVLLAENSDRTIRLDTIEAQYYRTLIENDWGAHHLEGNLGSFWSGASCRDISMVLPYSRIMAHASTLAEQISIAEADTDARIKVWQRDPQTGMVIQWVVEPHPDHVFASDDLNIHLDNGLEHTLRQWRQAAFPNEAGGVLMGYYDFNIGAVFVVSALPAPSDSISTPTGFVRGIEGLAEAVEEASKRTSGIVSYIGEWHSHPPGHSANPSGDDILQLGYLAKQMAEDGFSALQIIVGENDINCLRGTVCS